jgi:uncharacterized membrane protein
MSGVFRALLAFAFLAYPVGVYFGLARFGVAPIAWLLAALALLRLAFARTDRSIWPAAALALCVALLSAFTRSDRWMRYYPVLINGLALGVFAWSLRNPPPMIERLARLRQPDLPPAGVVWTRRVTQVWCVFFLVNGSIAFYTVQYASLAIWTLYNGLIAYLLVGLLLAGELLLRPKSARPP